MRYLILLALTITTAFSASISKSVYSEPHRVDKKDSIEHEISEALKDINASKHLIRMTMHVNDTDDEIPASFFRDVENVFSGMFDAIQNTHVPFFNHETVSPINETANQTTQDLLTRTRDDLKEDIQILKSRITHIRSDFNAWMHSNEHQEFRSMVIGGLSAVVVLVAYFLIRKCCRRRSRLNHLAAFANDGFSGNGDTDSLLPTKNNKRGRHYPSNSEEDI
ncbi:hypothetical protein GCK72_002111 [Caenorhabditis remanei]|uniref:Uncharacterized protein n=1 Tax=Caenorhabditis remanei TaxID=31234 RepID=E3LM25_CAERE|nr:hypothetical protein GCK72_002111 [Caenorhabditis remanei]EFP02850.1 hypothetical protein CRE_28050 [Caenorhabditis remanei]KAF1770293.1 hypothetical protein GCK72_002111 [Caenorhabditis remanei]